MKLFLDYTLNNSGKGKFLQRLIPALERLGVTTHFKDKGCDVALGISWWHTETKLPKVIRVDGVHLVKNDKNNWKNGRIKDGVKRADAVIYQSAFAQREVKRFLKLKDKKEFVVFNGADPKDYDVEPIDTGFPNNIIASGKWCDRNGVRKSKGLKATLQTMLEMKSSVCGLFVAGDVPEKYRSDGITFLGRLEEPMLRRWLKTCDTMVYMAKYDWCPNAVVEAVVAGCKIIYNPKCEALSELAVLKPEELHIDNIAKQYKHVLEEVL